MRVSVKSILKVPLELMVLLITTILIGCHGAQTFSPTAPATAQGGGQSTKPAGGNLVEGSYLGTISGPTIYNCEGCGQPGSIFFGAHGQANMQWREDDIIYLCSYSQNPKEVFLDCDGRRFIFLISAGGKILSHKGSEFILKKHN